MLGNSSPPTKTVMSFYQVHRPFFRTLTDRTFTNPLTKTGLLVIALASTTLLAVGCSHLGHTGAHTDHQSNANASAATGGQSADVGTETAEHSGEAGSGEEGHTEAHKHGIHTNHDIYHSKGLEVPAGTAVPAITVRVDTDPVRGWNLYVGTANFDFTPNKINGESGPTEGHAHLYVNDKPVQRIYGNWTHLPDLPAGENVVRVTLNANGHETLTTQGTPIEDSVTVEVYKPEQAQ